MNHVFTDPDLIELDCIWPLGQKLVVPENGTIIVAGAYEGRYVHYLSEMFPTAHIYGFEPQDEARAIAEKRLAGRPNVTFSLFALGTATRVMQLSRYGTDGASMFKGAGKSQQIFMTDAVNEFHKLPPIDLFVMNMEGSEWALLPYLMDEMMHHRIKTMAIQFHAGYVSMEREAEVFLKLVSYYRQDLLQSYPQWTLWNREESLR